MPNVRVTAAVLVVGCVAAAGAGVLRAGDWPQWRGPNRDGRVTDFTPPKAWPKQLKEQWKVAVGDGVATPALVGDKIYVFTRQDDNEVMRCLSAADGKELWLDKYPALAPQGAAARYAGPRASPAVSGGKVVTLGVRNTLSCLDAGSGKVVWRKDEPRGAAPRFFASSSPLVADGLCVAQVGDESSGGIVAYDLNSGEEKWKWTGDGPAYASPVLMTVGGEKLVVAETNRKVVAIGLADGKLAWETPFESRGMGGYNASTPVVEGQTLIISGGGRGTRAFKVEKDGEKIAAKEVWNNPEKAVQFNTPVLKDGLLYGLSQSNELFCINAQDGKSAWATQVAAPAGGPGMRGPSGPGGPRSGGPGGAGGPNRGPGAGGPDGERRQGGPGGGGPGGVRGGRGGGRGGGGFGSVVDAGTVLMALTPASELIVFQPGEKAYTEVAKIKVAEARTDAHPVLAGDKVLIKDQDSVMLLSIE